MQLSKVILDIELRLDRPPKRGKEADILAAARPANLGLRPRSAYFSDSFLLGSCFPKNCRTNFPSLPAAQDALYGPPKHPVEGTGLYILWRWINMRIRGCATCRKSGVSAGQVACFRCCRKPRYCFQFTHMRGLRFHALLTDGTPNLRFERAGCYGA